MLAVFIIFLALGCAVIDFIIRKDTKFTVEFLLILLIITLLYVLFYGIRAI